MCVKHVASDSEEMAMPQGRLREKPILKSMEGSATQIVGYSLMASPNRTLKPLSTSLEMRPVELAVDLKAHICDER